MNILTVSKRQDIACVLKDIVRQEVSIQSHQCADNALIHLQNTSVRYDLVILDNRDASVRSHQLYESIRLLCQCQILTIPYDSTPSSNDYKAKMSDAIHNSAPHSSQLDQQPIESLNECVNRYSFNIRPGVIEYHIPCTRTESDTKKNKPYLWLVTNNTARF